MADMKGPPTTAGESAIAAGRGAMIMNNRDSSKDMQVGTVHGGVHFHNYSNIDTRELDKKDILATNPENEGKGKSAETKKILPFADADQSFVRDIWKEVVKKLKEEDLKEMINIFWDHWSGKIGSPMKKPNDAEELYQEMKRHSIINENNIIYIQLLLWKIQSFELFTQVTKDADEVFNILEWKISHLAAPSLQPVNGCKHVQFHVVVDDLKTADVSVWNEVRREIALRLKIKLEYVRVVGMEPTTSVWVTIILPEEGYIRLLENFHDRNLQESFLKLNITTVRFLRNREEGDDDDEAVTMRVNPDVAALEGDLDEEESQGATLESVSMSSSEGFESASDEQGIHVSSPSPGHSSPPVPSCTAVAVSSSVACTSTSTSTSTLTYSSVKTIPTAVSAGTCSISSSSSSATTDNTDTALGAAATPSSKTLPSHTAPIVKDQKVDFDSHYEKGRVYVFPPIQQSTVKVFPKTRTETPSVFAMRSPPPRHAMEADKAKMESRKDKLKEEKVKATAVKLLYNQLQQATRPGDTPAFLFTSFMLDNHERDTVIFHEKYGVIVVKVEAVEDPKAFQPLQESAEQLLKARDGLKTKLRDLLEPDTITLLVALPNLTDPGDARQRIQILRDNPDIQLLCGSEEDDYKAWLQQLSTRPAPWGGQALPDSHQAFVQAVSQLSQAEVEAAERQYLAFMEERERLEEEHRW